MSICICKAVRCKAPVKDIETGEIYCQRERVVEAAITHAVVVAAERAGALAGPILADCSTLIRDLAAAGLEIRTIRKPRVAS